MSCVKITPARDPLPESVAGTVGFDFLPPSGSGSCVLAGRSGLPGSLMVDPPNTGAHLPPSAE